MEVMYNGHSGYKFTAQIFIVQLIYKLNIIGSVNILTRQSVKGRYYEMERSILTILLGVPFKQINL